MIKVKIRKLLKKEILGVAKIASESFFGMKDIKKSKKWIVGNFKNYPRMQYFVAKFNGKTVGYIVWTEKAGFRKSSVWELEQIAVAEKFRLKGVGKTLIKKSLSEIKKYLKKRRSNLKIIEVTTGKENKAKELYKKILGVKVECTIKDFLRGDEVIMIARKN